MLLEYVQAAMRRAKYEILPDNDGFVGRIEGFQGVWANADSLEQCREELQEVLEDWILIRLWNRLDLPTLDGLELKVRESEVA